MTCMWESYNLPIEELEWLYTELNREIRYPDGMVTSLGIIYWGRPEHYPYLADAANKIRGLGCTTLRSMLDSFRTPLRASQLLEQVRIHEGAIKILRHDLKMWLPELVTLDRIPLDNSLKPAVSLLMKSGINSQINLLNLARTRAKRKKLAASTNIDLKTLNSIVRYCDMYRLGSNLQYLRTPMYIEMGLDTWQKWAKASSEEIIERFERYRKSKTEFGSGLTPYPKEVRNGIEWAKMHLLMFEVEW